MDFYISGPDDKGEGVYHLVTETGELLASHFCSSIEWAPGDLEGRRKDRQAAWRQEYGAYRVVWPTDHVGPTLITGIPVGTLTRDQLLEANHALAEAAGQDIVNAN